MRAVVLAVITLGGCHQLFGLLPLPDAPLPPDAPLFFDASPLVVGCADVVREGFADVDTYPRLAACAGAWTVPGVRPDPVPTCGRQAGNTGSNVLGTGCSAADLCAEGWHVCRSRFDVLARTPTQSCDGLNAAPDSFFATGQSGPGGGNCDDTGTNDVFGCGSYGQAIQPVMGCTPLDRCSSNECSAIRQLGGWSCVNDQSEVSVLAKSDPLVGGGVLCCKDDGP